MAKTVTITLGYAANEVIPVATFLNSQSEANFKGHSLASFDSGGVAIIDVDSMTVDADDVLLFVGSNFNSVATYENRGIAADGVVADSGGGGGSTFAPLTVGYSSASFASDVVITGADPVKFSFIGISSAGTYYLLGGPNTAYVYLRATDGRVRFQSDSGSAKQFNGHSALVDGNSHDVELLENAGDTELWIDGVLAQTISGINGTCTFSCVGAQSVGGNTMSEGAVYNVEIGSADAWSMLGENDEFNAVNSLNGSNPLTYNDAPEPITSSDTVDTGA